MDIRKVEHELTEKMIRYQYLIDNPMSLAPFENMVKCYQRDPIFNNKVRCFVNSVMHTIESNN